MINLGTGILFESNHFDSILKSKKLIDWIELTSEHMLGSKINKFKPVISNQTEQIIDHFPVSLHGLELSIASVDPLDRTYLKGLKELVKIIRPKIISDHLVWTGAAGFKAYELLPFPYTKESLGHVVSRVLQVQEFVGMQFLFENPPAAIRFKHSQYTDAEFMNELAKQSGCGLIIDISNLYICFKNNGFEMIEFLNALNPKYVHQFHLAGFHIDKKSGFYLDTHAAPVSQEVWELFEYAVQKIGARSTNIEWFLGETSFKELYDHCKKTKVILKKSRPYAA